MESINTQPNHRIDSIDSFIFLILLFFWKKRQREEWETTMVKQQRPATASKKKTRYSKTFKLNWIHENWQLPPHHAPYSVQAVDLFNFICIEFSSIVCVRSNVHRQTAVHGMVEAHSLPVNRHFGVRTYAMNYFPILFALCVAVYSAHMLRFQ